MMRAWIPPFLLLVLATRLSAAEPTPRAAATTPASALHYRTEFSTYLGGSKAELIRDLTVDAQGNIYVAGSTGSADFPRSPGELPGLSKEAGGMIAKFSPAGALLWSRVFNGEYLYS